MKNEQKSELLIWYLTLRKLLGIVRNFTADTSDPNRNHFR